MLVDVGPVDVGPVELAGHPLAECARRAEQVLVLAAAAHGRRPVCFGEHPRVLVGGQTK